MFYLLIFLLQMKLIKLKTDLIKAIEFDKRLGFVPTMGSLHDGHKALIKKSKKNCKKTLVSIFINLHTCHNWCFKFIMHSNHGLRAVFFNYQIIR